MKMKKVQAVTSQGIVLAVYASAREAEKITKFRCIGAACRGDQVTSGAFIWNYAPSDAELNKLTLEELQAAKIRAVERGEHVSLPIESTSQKRIIQVVTSQGHVLATYKSQGQAARMTGIKDSHISSVCKGKSLQTSGYFFRYGDPGAQINELTSEELQEAREGAIARGEHVLVQKKKRKRAQSASDAEDDEVCEEEDDESDEAAVRGFAFSGSGSDKGAEKVLLEGR